MFLSKVWTRLCTSKPLIYSDKIRTQSFIIRWFSRKPNRTLKTASFMPNRRISFQSFRKPSVEKLKLNDNIPKEFDLIYRCTMSSYLYAAQISSTIGAIVVCGMAIVTYSPTTDLSINTPGVNLENILHSDYQFLVFAFSFVVLNITVMILTSRFPVRIYFNRETKKYIGVIHGKIPKSKDIIEFGVGEVKHTPKKGVLPWNEFNYKIKNGKTIVLLDHYFRKPDDMNVMLGYTKL